MATQQRQEQEQEQEEEQREGSATPAASAGGGPPSFSAEEELVLLAPRVREDKKHLIAAAVHVDGTGRIQTVEQSANPRYYGVIKAFGDLTGVPVLLNTSFNRQEPIVSTPAQAVSCYLRTGMYGLVLGIFYTTDRGASETRKAEAAMANVA